MNHKVIFIILILLLPAHLLAQVENLYELTKIEFVGNDEISSSELETIIFSEETPWWFYKFLNSFSGFGKEPVYFDSSNIEIDLNSLEDYYNVNGFFRAKFDYSYQVDTTDKEVTLTYHITENKPAMYDEVKFLGIDSIPINILNRIIGESHISTDIPFNQADVEASIAHTIEILINRGYALVRHDSTEIIIDTTSNTVDVNIWYFTGNRYKIKEINVVRKGVGADHVNDQLLKDLTAIEEEEYYNHEKMRKGQDRLVRTGLFNSLVFEPVIKDTNDSYLPLKLEGSIGSMNEILPGISMSDQLNSFYLVTNLSYSRKNFLGQARKLTLSNELGITDIASFSFGRFFSYENYLIDGFARINLKLEQPYLFQKPIFGTLETYFQTQTNLGRNEKTYGGKVSLEFEMPYYTVINQFKTYYNLEFLSRKLNSNLMQQYTEYGNSTISFLNTTSFLGLQLGSAKTNSLFYPTAGSNTLLNFEAAVSNLSINFSGEGVKLIDSNAVELDESETSLFYRAELISSYFFSLSNDLTSVFAVKHKAGYVQSIKGGAWLIPINRTFYSGGSNSLRGWRSKDLYPTEQAESFIISEVDTLRGGNFLFEGSFEYRKRFLESLGVALFLDYGNNWNGYKDFRFDQVAMAIGFGFRFYTSIAPFRLDFGFRLYDPHNKKFLWEVSPFKNFAFHFGIGEAF